MSDAFASLQERIRSRLTSDAWFQDIPIITQDQGDIEALVEEQIYRAAVAQNAALKGGLAIVIVTPEGDNVEDKGEVVVLQSTVRVLIVENGAVNRGEGGVGKLPTEVLQRAIVRLHGYREGGGQGPAKLLFQRFSYDLLDGIGQFMVDFEFQQLLNTNP